MQGLGDSVDDSLEGLVRHDNTLNAQGIWRTGANGKSMPEQPWKPHATVAAAICERDGKYLLVREQVDGQNRFNQPAGHIEPGESVLQAVVRETLEETRYAFRSRRPCSGIYRFQPAAEDECTTYLRFRLFRGEVGERLEDDALDQGIIAAEWLNYDEACWIAGTSIAVPMVTAVYR